jgi:hypothetical protein
MDRILEQRILDILPREGNQATCPKCPAVARFRSVVSRQVLTSHGERTVACRYYYCAACGHGFAPREGRSRCPPPGSRAKSRRGSPPGRRACPLQKGRKTWRNCVP